MECWNGHRWAERSRLANSHLNWIIYLFKIHAELMAYIIWKCLTKSCRNYAATDASWNTKYILFTGNREHCAAFAAENWDFECTFKRVTARTHLFVSLPRLQVTANENKCTHIKWNHFDPTKFSNSPNSLSPFFSSDPIANARTPDSTLWICVYRCESEIV